ISSLPQSLSLVISGGGLSGGDGGGGGGGEASSSSGAGASANRDRRMQLAEWLVLDLLNPDLRKNALLKLSKEQLTRTSTNSTGYLPPPTNTRYQVTLFTKARADRKRSPSICLPWKLNLTPHGAHPNFIEPLRHTMGVIQHSFK
ncbi:hypothetical protein FXO38_05414, partial [Capsicum annuum]